MASERALAGRVPTIGARSDPAQGHGIPSGHQPGFWPLKSEAGSARAAFPGIQTVVPLTAS